MNIKAIIAAIIMTTASAANAANLRTTEFKCDGGHTMTMVWDNDRGEITEIWLVEKGRENRHTAYAGAPTPYVNTIDYIADEPGGYTITVKLHKKDQPPVADIKVDDPHNGQQLTAGCKA
ncbi:TPA: hypothetical protein ACGFBK_004528 [Escherichia coli]